MCYKYVLFDKNVSEEKFFINLYMHANNKVIKCDNKNSKDIVSILFLLEVNAGRHR